MTNRESPHGMEITGHAGPFSCESLSGLHEWHAAALGAWADLRFSIMLAMPSPLTGMVDFAAVSCVLGLHRSSDTQWPMFAPRNFGGTPADVNDPVASVLPLEPASELAPGVPNLVMPSFSTPGCTYQLNRSSDDRSRLVLCPGGPDPCDVTSGWAYPATAPIRAPKDGLRARYSSSVGLPLRRLVADLMIHRGLDFATDITAQAFFRTPGIPESEETGPTAVRLPMTLRLAEHDGPAPEIDHPQARHLAQLPGIAAHRLGRCTSEFRTYRLQIGFPPVNAVFMFSHRLLGPTDPAAG